MNFRLEKLDEKYRQILKETFPSETWKDYIIINGTVCVSKFLEFAEAIFNFEVRDDDVWICSIPKSGTIWTKEMVWLVANDLDYEGAKENVNVRVPIFEWSTLRERPIQELLPYVTDSITTVKNMKSPRFIQTHLPWELLPLQIQNGTKRPKMVYVARNPKDVCTSLFHHDSIHLGYRGTLEQLCELLMAGKIPGTPYWSHLFSFWERRNEPNILFLKYEDMKKDLSSVIEAICEFLGKRINEKQMEKLLKHLSFESMKVNQAVNFETMAKFKQGHFMRKGVVGSYKDEMPDELIKRFDEWIKENTEGTGLTF